MSLSTANKAGAENDPRVSGLLLQHAQAMKAGDFDRAAEALQQIRELSGAGENSISSRWLRLSDEPRFLLDAPPKTDWLFTRWHDGREVGVLPRGKTGLITATGGVGKTYLLMQIALAVALGGFWLETFRVASPGNVLLALGEEDRDEAERRLWRTANALELSAEQRRAAKQFLHVLPLHGVPVALTSSPSPGIVNETDVATFLRSRMAEAGVDWSLVILDPLSRWGGGGVEKDNEIATRFCQVVERFAELPGKPAVLVAHHSSLASTQAGESGARGVTALRDGFRWMVSIDAVSDEATGAKGLRLRNKKSNYSLEFEEVMLARNTEPGIEGTIRLATAGEAAELGTAVKGRNVTADELKERVLESVRKRPDLKSANDIAKITTGTRPKILEAVKTLLRDGDLAVEGGSFVVRQAEANR